MTNEKMNVPELRFPGFEDEWEELRLGELGSFSKGKGISKSDLSETGNKCILYGELYTKYGSSVNEIKSYTLLDTKNLVKGILGQVLIPSSGETPIDIATATVINTDEDVYIGGDLNIISLNNDTDGKFISFSINGKNKEKLSKFAQGKTVVHLYNNDVKKLAIKIPKNLDEQQRIGDFFIKLDRQIELEEQKLEKLEQQKKGYMQKIFSQQLRFKDENGDNYPDWEEEKLGDLYDKGKAGGTPKSTVAKYYNGDIPFLSISDITEQGKFIVKTEKKLTESGLQNSTAWLVPKYSINYAMYASVGYLSINKITLATSQAIFNMTFNDHKIVEYIYYYLNYIREINILEKLVGTGTQSNLSASTMKKMVVTLPCKKELEKVVGILVQLDNSINLQIRKIESLNNRKNGFLQKMFV